MIVYAGIDEAGYGPMLGPLCVACTVFTIEHNAVASPVSDDCPCDLWKRLAKAVCRKRADKRRRIAVDDSKLLKGANDAKAHPLKHLERGVLAFHLAARDCPSCDSELFDRLDVAMSAAAWYSSSTPLPVAHTADEMCVVASRLRSILARESICCEMIRCEAIDCEPFNRQVSQMGSKASVNFCAVLRLIDAIWRRWPADHPRIIIDRQGGRSHYLNELLLSFPDAQVQVLEESNVLSRYRLQRNDQSVTLSFVVEAERQHLPVALASMCAKYVRELMMARLNRYFQALMPELKPTAGYTEDARRYLAEIDPLISELKIDRQTLIRSV